MAQARLTGWQCGRLLTQGLGGLLLGALIVGLAADGTAQNKVDPKGKPDPKGPSVAKPVPPPPLRLTIVSKDKDVADTVKAINESLDKAWKANNIVQSRWADDYEFLRRASL